MSLWRNHVKRGVTHSHNGVTYRDITVLEVIKTIAVITTIVVNIISVSA